MNKIKELFKTIDLGLFAVYFILATNVIAWFAFKELAGWNMANSYTYILLASVATLIVVFLLRKEFSNLRFQVISLYLLLFPVGIGAFLSFAYSTVRGPELLTSVGIVTAIYPMFLLSVFDKSIFKKPILPKTLLSINIAFLLPLSFMFRLGNNILYLFFIALGVFLYSFVSLCYSYKN